MPVSWDPLPRSGLAKQHWPVGRRAWETATGDWHLVLEDDALPCRDLLDGLELALPHVPDDVGIISPYLGTVRPQTAVFFGLVHEADRVGASWIRQESAWWGVALAVRTVDVPAMLTYCDPLSFAYDTRIGHYFRQVRGQATFYPWPSLVDHRDGPSLSGHAGQRRAHRWHEGSALDLDWSGPVVDRAEPYLPGARRRPGEARRIVRG